MRRLFSVQVLAVLSVHVSAAFAGHPMLSEDTGTQGRGNAELELGYEWDELSGMASLLFQPQLSVGASSTVDLIVQPSWLVTDVEPQGRVHAFGDTNLDVKWRFYGSAPWSLGIRGGLEVPTAGEGLGLPHHKVAPHAILVATGDYKPFSFDANLGMARLPADAGERADLYHVSVAGLYEQSERVFFIVDTAVDSNPSTTGRNYLKAALVGVIFTAYAGLDIDVGYRTRLDPGGVVHQWLVGFTFRGAL